MCLLHPTWPRSHGMEWGTCHACLQALGTPSRSQPPAHLELHAIAGVDGDGVGAVQAAIIEDTSRLWGHQPALGARQRPVAGGW